MITATVRPLVGSTLRTRIQPSISMRPSPPSLLSSTSSTSYLSTKAYKTDKYKRMIRRRVIVGKKKNASTSRRRRSGSFFSHLVVPKNLPKILVGANVTPQFLPPPPNPICIESLTGTAIDSAAADAASSSTAASIGNSVASTGAAALAGTASSTIAAATTSIQQQAAIATTTTTTTIRTSKKFIQWLNSNIDVLILNAGSVATLTAFSRTDILELRLLSIMGSTGTVVYFMCRPPSQRIYLPILWSSIFVLTNAYMVYQIVEERNGGLSTPLDEEEEFLYEEHFKDYGVTPRQFERLLSKATRRFYKKDTIVIRSGDICNSVFLVAKGKTEACTSLSKRITAAGSTPRRALILAGGDSGAWIGEMAFLEMLSNGDFDKGGVNGSSGGGGGGGVEEEMTKQTAAMVEALSPIASSLSSSLGGVTSMEGIGESRKVRQPVDVDIFSPSSTQATAQSQSQQQQQQQQQEASPPSPLSSPPPTTTPIQLSKPSPIQPSLPPHMMHHPKTSKHHSLLTYTATKDSIVFEWTYEDLSELLTSSADFRSSLTRAMTAAVMGKVVNLYSSGDKNHKNTAGWW